MSRQRLGLRPPRDGDAAAIPSVGRRRPLWRATAPTRDNPWWYSTRSGGSSGGRFDLPAPKGTSYWALTGAAAIIEATADPDQVDPPLLSLAALGRLVVWRAEHVPAARSRLADFTVASVPTLTAEIGTTVPYALCHQWADAVAAAGNRGILWRGRFAQEDCIALFGTGGLRPLDRAPVALPSTGTDHWDELPPAFRHRVETAGRLDDYHAGGPPR